MTSHGETQRSTVFLGYSPDAPFYFRPSAVRNGELDGTFTGTTPEPQGMSVETLRDLIRQLKQDADNRRTELESASDRDTIRRLEGDISRIEQRIRTLQKLDKQLNHR